MARYNYQGVARDGMGRVISGATISVYEAGGSTPADVYLASVGGSAVNSVTSGDDGHFYFWADTSDYSNDQRFKISISKDNFITKEYDDLTVFAVEFELSDDSSPSLSADLDLNGNNIVYSSGSSVSPLEIGYLDGATSGGYTTAAAEFAAEARQALTTQGDTLYASAANVLARLALGTKDYSLFAGSTAPEYGLSTDIRYDTRAADATTGTQKITTAFRPSSILIVAYSSSSNFMSCIGLAERTGSNNYCLYNAGAVTPGHWAALGTKCIGLYEDGGTKKQEANVSLWEDDGVTFSFTRTGATAAGTINIYLLAIR